MWAWHGPPAHASQRRLGPADRQVLRPGWPWDARVRHRRDSPWRTSSPCHQRGKAGLLTAASVGGRRGRRDGLATRMGWPYKPEGVANWRREKARMIAEFFDTRTVSDQILVVLLVTGVVLTSILLSILAALTALSKYLKKLTKPDTRPRLREKKTRDWELQCHSCGYRFLIVPPRQFPKSQTCPRCGQEVMLTYDVWRDRRTRVGFAIEIVVILVCLAIVVLVLIFVLPSLYDLATKALLRLRHSH